MATDVLRRIVAPTDFSECAEEAWALTQRLAEALGSEVVNRALLGSVADRVIRTAPCPVLTVRKPDSE